jgi:regulatory protein
MEDKAYTRVFEKVINYLSYRPHTVFEIKTRLSKYLANEKLSEEVLEVAHAKILSRLDELGYLNDTGAAYEFVQSAISSSKPRSRRKLYASLANKGFDSHTIKAALGNFTDEVERGNLEKDYHKRFDQLPGELSYQEKQKAISYLLQKGYVSDFVLTFFNKST